MQTSVKVRPCFFLLRPTGIGIKLPQNTAYLDYSTFIAYFRHSQHISESYSRMRHSKENKLKKMNSKLSYQ